MLSRTKFIRAVIQHVIPEGLTHGDESDNCLARHLQRHLTTHLIHLILSHHQILLRYVDILSASLDSIKSYPQHRHLHRGSNACFGRHSYASNGTYRQTKTWEKFTDPLPVPARSSRRHQRYENPRWTHLAPALCDDGRYVTFHPSLSTSSSTRLQHPLILERHLLIIWWSRLSRKRRRRPPRVGPRRESRTPADL